MHIAWNFGRDENESVGVGSGGWSEGGNRKTTVILPCQALYFAIFAIMVFKTRSCTAY